MLRRYKKIECEISLVGGVGPVPKAPSGSAYSDHWALRASSAGWALLGARDFMLACSRNTERANSLSVIYQNYDKVSAFALSSSRLCFDEMVGALCILLAWWMDPKCARCPIPQNAGDLGRKASSDSISLLVRSELMSIIRCRLPLVQPWYWPWNYRPDSYTPESRVRCKGAHGWNYHFL